MLTSDLKGIASLDSTMLVEGMILWVLVAKFCEEEGTSMTCETLLMRRDVQRSCGRYCTDSMTRNSALSSSGVGIEFRQACLTGLGSRRECGVRRKRCQAVALLR